MKKHLFLVSAMGLALAACGGDDTVEQAAKEHGITTQDLARRIAALSDDKFEGRAPGTPGGKAASQYIADEMKAAGLVPMGENGTYFQPVTLTEATVQLGTEVILDTGDDYIGFEQGENAVFWTKRSDEKQSFEDSELIFVGYGTVASEFDWNDYSGMDFAGKTVVMLVNDPGYATKDPDLFKGASMTYYGRWTYKFEEAGRQGADAVLVVHETAPASYGWDVVAGSWTGAQYDLMRPDGGASRAKLEGWLHKDAAVKIFDEAGLDFEEMKIAAKTRGFKPVPMGDLKLQAEILQKVTTVQSRNVAGGVKGTKTPDEYVLYMGHWDHLGKKDGAADEDTIFNGAVDNATGTAAIIEVGEAFAQGPAPDRSIIVVAVTAEESGLLGSAYYGEDPLVPLNKTVAGINIDAILPIGETKDMIVVGYGASELEDRLKSIITPRGMYLTPDPKPEAGYYYRSDHISLAKKGVPMLYADSGIDHKAKGKEFGEAFGDEYTLKRYHKPADEYDSSWDLSGIVATTEILYELGMNLSNTETWPNWYEGTEFRALRDAMLK